MSTVSVSTSGQPEAAPERSAAVARRAWRAAGTAGSWFLSKVPELVLQILLIVVGIVLGLKVNEWTGERSDRELKLNLLSGFEQEIGKNLAHLQDDVDNMEGVRESLGEMSAAGELRTAGEFYDRVGLNVFRRDALLTTAWQTAVSTGSLRQLDDDYATASMLSEIYTRQAEYDRRSESRMPEFLRTGAAPPGSVREMVRAADRYLKDETEDGENLIEDYRQAVGRVAAARRRLGG
jgi:hypothetical protein